MSSTRVLILRHGQSEWNAEGRWQGQADIELTDHGREQARLAAGLVASECPPFEAVVSSDLARAAETADIVAGVLGCTNRHRDPRWRENHAGEWQGLTADEIRAQWPGYLENDRRAPSFETVESTIARTFQALTTIARRHTGGCVLVVSHGGVLRVLRHHLGAAEQRFPNLGGAWFEFDGSRWHNGSLLFPLELLADELRNNGQVE